MIDQYVFFPDRGANRNEIRTLGSSRHFWSSELQYTLEPTLDHRDEIYAVFHERRDGYFDQANGECDSRQEKQRVR